MRAGVAVMLVVSCRSPQPAPAPIPVAPEEMASVDAVQAIVPTTPDASAPDASTKPACPGSFQAAQSAPCVLSQPAVQCAYTEGDCYCRAPPQCGGAYMHHPLGSGGNFQCSPKIAGILRSDGCPFTAPANGTACATVGKSCVYGPCSWSQTTATCKGSAWVVTQYDGPPPP